MQKMGLLREKSGSGKLACERSPFMFPQMKKSYDLLVEEVRESVSYQIGNVLQLY